MNEVAIEPTSFLQRVWYNQGLRTVLFMLLRIVLFGLFAFAIGWLMQKLIPLPRLNPGKALAVTGAELWLRALRSMVPTVLAYWLLVRFVERRRVSELAANKALLYGAKGWLIGTGVLLAAAAAMALVGAYSIHGFNPDAYLVGPLMVLGIGAGVNEEIMARGILFRVVEDAFGTWAALVVSSLLFGFAHYSNPNATLWSSIAIAIEAGLLLGMAYAWTRSLWFCMGLHAAWNFTQGPLLGIPVSGFDLDGLLRSTTQGPVLLSGGEFGAEASVLTVVICVTVAGYFTRKAIDEGKIKAPFWARRGTAALTPAD